MNRVSLAVLLGMAVGAACSEPQIITIPELNLDRPVDIAFACHGPLRLKTEAGEPVVSSAQPAVSCEVRSPQAKKDVQEPPAGQEMLDSPSWYGFILQSAPGTVAVARWPTGPAESFSVGADFTVLDVDPLTPAKNAISIGEEPIAIATDRAGCYAVTANAGSCDMSTLEVNGAVDGDPSTPIVVKRVQVKNASGVPILARPAAMLAEPGTTAVGARCPAMATGLVYVAYPSCHLVAAVDMATERIVAGIRFDATGVTVTDGNVTCHDECPNDGNVLGGPPPTSGPRPVTIDLEVDVFSTATTTTTTRRLAIGADNLAAVTVVELDANFRPVVAPALQIPLENTTGNLGVSTVSLSPRILMGNDSGSTSSAGPGQYVYAVATDDTVRVVDVLDIRKECDTQVDPRFVRGRNARALQCFPVDDPATPVRRVGARGPGIQMPDHGVPTSVAIIKGLREVPDAVNSGQQRLDANVLVGHFAVITTTTGDSFIANVDDERGPDLFSQDKPLETAPTLTMAHQLRDSASAREAGPAAKVDTLCDVANPESGATTGGPRTAIPLSNARSGVAGVISPQKSLELPIFHQVECVIPMSADADKRRPVSEMQLAAPGLVRDQVYPDLGAVRGETWTLTWEGALSTDNAGRTIDGPVIRPGQMRVDSAGMHLTDQSRPFCEMGVEPFDIVEFRGCNPLSSDCPVGYDCLVHPEAQNAIGVCILSDEAPRLVNACRDFLKTIRHYSVGRADSGELTLLPRKHVLRTTPVDGCIDDAQCKVLADYAATIPSAADPLTDQTPPDPRTWSCLADDTRAPVNSDPLRNKRCVQTCGLHGKDIDGKDRDADCDASTICQGATAITRGICMEGVTPPQACVNGPQRFEVHASEAFAVIGTVSGFIHPLIADATQGGRCIRDPDASPLQIGRLPLKAPPCTASPPDPITDLLPNPCSLMVQQSENQINYSDPLTCTINPTIQTTFKERAAPAIKFRHRNMTLTLVDPVYPGDGTCLLDREGGLGAIPLVFPGYQLAFTQNGAFTPLRLTAIGPSFPVKVVRGPGDSIWVIDDGDLQSNSISTRGGVYRVDPISLGLYVLLQ